MAPAAWEGYTQTANCVDQTDGAECPPIYHSCCKPPTPSFWIVFARQPFPRRFHTMAFSPPKLCEAVITGIFRLPRRQAAAKNMLDRRRRNSLSKSRRTRQRAPGSEINEVLSRCWVRGGNFPRPRSDVGNLAAALAAEGVFRLRGVLVGTVAYQTYPAMLGVRLPAALIQTSDVDVAQFADVSAAMGDATRPMPDVLRQVDSTFRSVPHIDPGRTVSYVSASGLRVDFLTPNRGKDTEEPRNLPSLRTDAQPLRFLDFLIRDPEPAVLLHDTGILVTVPAPQRFALHKLIVARRRRDDGPKREKDLRQARALLDVLIERRPHELRAAWAEASRRGRSWQRLMGEGLGLLHPATRDTVLQAVGATRSFVPGLNLQFVPDRAGYDREIDGIRFFAATGGPFVFAQEGINCTVSRDVLSAIAGVASLEPDGCLEAFRRHRPRIEQAATAKYLNEPVDTVGGVSLTRADKAILEITS